MDNRDRLALAYAFGRSLLSWHVDATPRPLSVSYAVTNRCNLRCSYCNTPFLDPSELSLDRVRLLFERLAELGVKRIGLAGGEPLVRKDLGEIISFAKEHGFYVTLNSNLTLYGKRSDAVAQVDLFFTSLDGDQASHEAARGPRSYDGVIAAIRSLVALGRRVVAICVVNEHSADQALGLLTQAEGEGFLVHFQPQCLDTAIVRGSLPASLGQRRLSRFWSELLAEKAAGRPVASSRPYLEALASWPDFRRSAVLDPTTRCAAAHGFFYIDPQGMAYPCAYTKGKAAPIDFLGPDWRSVLGQKTPCTRCAVGPHLEYNLLYQKPIRAALSVLDTYL